MMRDARVWVAGLIALTWAFGGAALRAEDEAPADPTRGHLTFLDPVRDLEDKVVGAQKSFEDSTKIHIGAGLTKAYTWSFNQPNSGSLTLHSLESHNEPSIDLGQLSLSRPSEGWFVPGFGLKLDFGKVARRIKADWNGNGSIGHGDIFETNNFDAQEVYLNWAVPDDSPALKGLTVKGGKFVTLLGAEVIEPWSNFNYSRSFLFSFAIPFTHTGVLVSYPLTDKISVTGGAIEGWDKVASNNNGWSGIGNVTYAANDMVTFGLNGIWGPEQTGNLSNKRGIVDAVATIKPTAALTLLLNYDWGQEDGAALDGGQELWQGFAAVANYNFTERCSAALRGEFMEDNGGGRTGQDQTLWELTATAKYLVTQHFYTRLEYRHDESTNPNTFPADHTAFLLAGQDIISMEWTYLFN